MKCSLYTIGQWESARPDSVVFVRAFYSVEEPGKIKSVQGYVKARKRILLSDGHYCLKDCCRKVVWNADGHCYIGNFQKRAKRYDIHLDQPTNKPK